MNPSAELVTSGGRQICLNDVSCSPTASGCATRRLHSIGRERHSGHSALPVA
jgi:hypothetical protein